MVLGIGIDIIEIERIKRSVEKYGERFISKIFTQKEIDYCLPKANKFQHLAARFAAKEAIAKSLSYSGEEGFNWQDIEIYNEKNGMPKVRLFNKLLKILGNDKQIHITMSHSENYVTCFALLEKLNID